MKIDTIKKIIIFIIKYIFKAIVVLCMLVALLFLYNVGIVPSGRLAEGINQKSISSIKLGMSRCEVIERLGIPFDSSEYYILSSKGKVKPENIVITYMYSNPGILWDIEIYVNFNRNDKVIRVNMQEGDGNFFVYDAQHPKKEINFETYNRIIPKTKKAKQIGQENQKVEGSRKVEGSGDSDSTSLMTTVSTITHT